MYLNHNIKSSYYEKNKEELTLLSYQRIQIEEYVQQMFFRNSLFLQKLLFQINNKCLNLVVYYYKINHDTNLLKKSLSKKRCKLKKIYIHRSFLKPQKKRLKKTNYMTLSKLLTLPKIKRLFKQRAENEEQRYTKKRFSDKRNIQPTVLKYYNKFYTKKHFGIKSNLKKNTFCEHLLETLTRFTKKKFHVSIIFKNINKRVNLKTTLIDKTFLKKQTLLFKKHARQKYFKDCLNIFFICAKVKDSNNLLSRFLAEQLRYLKYHKPFLSFVTKLLQLIISSRNFPLKGLKLVISGRLNNKPRAKTLTTIIGKIPIINQEGNNLNYSENTCYTKNGTFGIKVWSNYF